MNSIRPRERHPPWYKSTAPTISAPIESTLSTGWAVVLTVDSTTWTVTKGTPLEFDATLGTTPALTQIDGSHFLCAYTGNGNDGWAVVLTTGNRLRGHWKLDEAAGTTAADSSGNGNHGTLTNMAGTEWTTGQVDGALEFDGNNDYITGIGNCPTGDFTVLGWALDTGGSGLEGSLFG